MEACVGMVVLEWKHVCVGMVEARSFQRMYVLKWMYVFEWLCSNGSMCSNGCFPKDVCVGMDVFEWIYIQEACVRMVYVLEWKHVFE